MDQNVVIAVDHSPQSENAVKCEHFFVIFHSGSATRGPTKHHIGRIDRIGYTL